MTLRSLVLIAATSAVPVGVLALVLMFSDPQQVEGIEEDAKFRFKCRVTNFDYQYLNMDKLYRRA